MAANRQRKGEVRRSGRGSRWQSPTGGFRRRRKGKLLAGHCKNPTDLRRQIDYAVIGDDQGSVNLWINSGKTTHVTPALGGYAAGVRFADLNGDGYDDYFNVDDGGRALCYTNGGPINGGWSWTQKGVNGLVAIGVGAKRNQVHFADLNGLTSAATSETSH